MLDLWRIFAFPGGRNALMIRGIETSASSTTHPLAPFPVSRVKLAATRLQSVESIAIISRFAGVTMFRD